MNKNTASPAEPSTNQARDTDAAGPTTFRRGLRVLAALQDAGPDGLHVTEVARAADMQRSTVYRFLNVLLETGWATRDAAVPRYRLAHPVGMTVDPHAAAVARWAPALRAISDDTGDSAFLICRAGNDSLCLHREVGNYPVQVLAVTIGHRQPLGVGAAGLAYLAALPPDEANEIIAHNKNALNAYGAMNGERLHKLVESARDRGWAVVGNSAVPGVLGVGVALLDSLGRPTFALSVSSILARMPAARQRQIAESIVRRLKAES